MICDGGYHRWPCLISPVKAGIPGSAVMKWSAKIESIRKDIEGVFGILKKRFKFLKNFNSLHKQSSIDNAFVTCCNLPPFPGGVEERLAKVFGNIHGNTWNGTAGLWNRVNDYTPAGMESDRNNLCNNTNPTGGATNKENWAIGWAKVTSALVDHHQYGCATANLLN